MTKPIVEIENLCFTRGTTDILHNINLKVNEGDFVSIVGPNGGGKTTLLRLILGILKPSRGTIHLRSKNPAQKRASIGYVPQHVNHNLSFPSTALDVVMMGTHDPSRKFKLGHSRQERELGMQLLEKLGIGDLADRKIVALSGGQRQRVLIARALISHPELLVLDEPTASIDTKGRIEFYEILKELNKELTILMVSHDLMIVSSYAKSIACLNWTLHYHPHITSSQEVLDAYYSCSVDDVCQVGLIAGVEEDNPGEG